MDRVLHEERLEAGGGKRAYPARLSELPDGVMVDRGGVPHLWWRGGLRPWSFEGYGPPLPVSAAEKVAVLTPASTVRAIAAGFAPQVHESADR
jgi:hypothetical protein